MSEERYRLPTYHNKRWQRSYFFRKLQHVSHNEYVYSLSSAKYLLDLLKRAPNIPHSSVSVSSKFLHLWQKTTKYLVLQQVFEQIVFFQDD
uniref:Uncharacterized protein n=1 Tax=Heterorhabditis bacteriophora TaxID=37862 RepID=A0A1I7X5P6_HETBA